MISNNNATQSHSTSNSQRQGNPLNVLTNIQRSFSQSQSSSSGTAPFTLNTDSLQNLLQLIQALISQLGNNAEQEPEKESNPEPMQNKDKTLAKENNPPVAEKGLTDTQGISGLPAIFGTSGDDTLEGTRVGEAILGREGDDRLLGRQGNDFLAGDQGNDRLYGGKGNDTLQGGEGNDYLSGGRGNNELSGGAGNDTLYTRLGSDTLDGGTGTDTARIRASIDDYTIAVVEQDSPAIGLEGANNENPALGAVDNTTLVLTNKETGQTIEVVNIEKFRFDDARLSLAEMKQRAETSTDEKQPQNDQLLTLSVAEQEGVLGVFGADGANGNAGIRVVDEDNSGGISEGDTAVLATGDASSVSQQFKTLSAEDVENIKGTATENPSRPQVDLTAAQKQAVAGVTGLRDVHVDDTDGSGSLSAGDVAVSAVQGSQKKELSAADVEAILDFQPPSVALTDVQRNALEALTGLSDIRVDDNDLSGTLSAGDDVVSATGEKITLTAENIATSSSEDTSNS